MLNRSCILGLHSTRKTSGQRLKHGVSLSKLALSSGFESMRGSLRRKSVLVSRPGCSYTRPVGICLHPGWLSETSSSSSSAGRYKSHEQDAEAIHELTFAGLAARLRAEAHAQLVETMDFVWWSSRTPRRQPDRAPRLRSFMLSRQDTYVSSVLHSKTVYYSGIWRVRGSPHPWPFHVMAACGKCICHSNVCVLPSTSSRSTKSVSSNAYLP